MRWSCSRVKLALLLTACTTVTTRYFMPSPQNPIYRPAQTVAVLSEYVRLQCPAFRRAAKPDSGSALFTVEVDSMGFATRSRLDRGTGDDLLDGVFGTVTAQLTFPRESSRRRVRRERVQIDFRCVGDSSVVRVDAGST
jgi:hypothetical protein